MAGTMKLESPAWSATFTGTPAVRAASATRSSTAGRPVAANTMALAVDVAGDEAAADRGDLASIDRGRDLLADPRRHDGDAGARLLQQPQPPGRRFAAAHDQGGPVLQIEKCRKVIHGRLLAAKMPGPRRTSVAL